VKKILICLIFFIAFFSLFSAKTYAAIVNKSGCPNASISITVGRTPKPLAHDNPITVDTWPGDIKITLHGAVANAGPFTVKVRGAGKEDWIFSDIHRTKKQFYSNGNGDLDITPVGFDIYSMLQNIGSITQGANGGDKDKLKQEFGNTEDTNRVSLHPFPDATDYKFLLFYGNDTTGKDDVCEFSLSDYTYTYTDPGSTTDITETGVVKPAFKDSYYCDATVHMLTVGSGNNPGNDVGEWPAKGADPTDPNPNNFVFDHKHIPAINVKGVAVPHVDEKEQLPSVYDSFGSDWVNYSIGNRPGCCTAPLNACFNQDGCSFEIYSRSGSAGKYRIMLLRRNTDDQTEQQQMLYMSSDKVLNGDQFTDLTAGGIPYDQEASNGKNVLFCDGSSKNPCNKVEIQEGWYYAVVTTDEPFKISDSHSSSDGSWYFPLCSQAFHLGGAQPPGSLLSGCIPLNQNGCTIGATATTKTPAGDCCTDKVPNPTCMVYSVPVSVSQAAASSTIPNSMCIDGKEASSQLKQLATDMYTTSGKRYTPRDVCPDGICETALGNIATTPEGFVNSLLSVVLSVVGGIAIILIIISGYRLMISQGNPENLKNAKDQLTAAIVGLLFVIFSLVLLQVIGYNILGLPGFNQ